MYCGLRAKKCWPRADKQYRYRAAERNFLYTPFKPRLIEIRLGSWAPPSDLNLPQPPEAHHYPSQNMWLLYALVLVSKRVSNLRLPEVMKSQLRSQRQILLCQIKIQKRFCKDTSPAAPAPAAAAGVKLYCASLMNFNRSTALLTASPGTSALSHGKQ